MILLLLSFGGLGHYNGKIRLGWHALILEAIEMVHQSIRHLGLPKHNTMILQINRLGVMVFQLVLICAVLVLVMILIGYMPAGVG